MLPPASKTMALILVVLGVLLGLLAWTMGGKRQPESTSAAIAPVAQPVSGEAVVVAVKPIAAGKPVQPEDVGLEKLPLRPQGAYVQTADLVGKVLALDVPAGVPVLETFVWQGLAPLLNEGERAVSIKVEEANAVGHQLRPGDWVDVFFHLRRDNQDVGQSQARLLLARKRVLAYGPSVVEQAARAEKSGGGSGASGGAANQRATARTAVLAVGVEDVNPLALAEHQGQLLLALRNPEDLGLPNPELWPGWPTAVVASAKAGTTLAAMDMARAGVSMPVLANGGGRAQPPLPARAGRVGSTPRDSVEVEFIRGNQSGSVRY